MPQNDQTRNDLQLFDVIIIGGGIVGLATALALIAERELRVALVEAESGIARHQTGRNSGVIHAGLYYEPGSFKARLCAEGRDAMYDFCRANGIPHRRCGKVIVATDEVEHERLTGLLRRAHDNGLNDVRMVDRQELRCIEPAVCGLGALHVPVTGVVDFQAVAGVMAAQFTSAGGTIRSDWPVLNVRRYDDAFTLYSRVDSLHTRAVIGCAGLQSDRVARLFGLRADTRIIPFRGEYFEVRQESASAVRALVYPVPDPTLPFLGVHFTRSVTDQVELGPNAVLTWSRHGYRRGAVEPRDALEIVTHLGFWRLAARHWRSGAGELHRSMSVEATCRAARRMIPAIRAEDIRPSRCGVRAQAVNASGDLVADFVFAEGERTLHVLNAPSPAATASLAIGRHVAARALRMLE